MRYNHKCKGIYWYLIVYSSDSFTCVIAPAFCTPAICSCIFNSCIFHSRIFAFSAPSTYHRSDESAFIPNQPTNQTMLHRLPFTDPHRTFMHQSVINRPICRRFGEFPQQNGERVKTARNYVGNFVAQQGSPCFFRIEEI